MLFRFFRRCIPLTPEEQEEKKGKSCNRKNISDFFWRLVLRLRELVQNQRFDRRGAIVCRTVPGNPGRGFESAEAFLSPTRVESQQFDRPRKTFLYLPG